MSPQDVALYVLHQANIRIINNVAEQLAIPEDKMFNNLQQYGNTSGGSIPIALDEAIQAGLTFMEARQTGGFRVVVDNTTYGKDGNFVFNRGNVMYAADIVAFNLGDLRAQPVYVPISQIVYAGHRDQVTDVWVAGRRVVREGVLQTINEYELGETAQRWRDKIAGG
jgi:hypothetical protein